MAKTHKRILSVTVRRMVDDSPDTSHLGEYSNRSTSQFTIDRAHAEDCASVQDVKQAKQTLEHVQQTIGDMQNDIPRFENGDLTDQTEWEALENAYNEIGELIDSIDECDCGEHGDMGRGEFRYFNPSFNYVTKSDDPADSLTAEDVRKYVRQDYARMESANRGDWCYIGIRAEAEVQIASDVVQEITSGGLWGIESDCDRAYIEEEQDNQLADLKTELISLGFSKRAISTAFKSVEEKDE